MSLIEPGSVGTDMVDEPPERQREMTRELRMLRSEDVAESIIFMLRQPKYCDIVLLQLRPHLQLI